MFIKDWIPVAKGDWGGCSLIATILDKINGTSGPPLPPISMMPKWRVFAPSRLYHCFGGEGG